MRSKSSVRSGRFRYPPLSGAHELSARIHFDAANPVGDTGESTQPMKEREGLLLLKGAGEARPGLGRRLGVPLGGWLPPR